MESCILNTEKDSKNLKYRLKSFIVTLFALILLFSVPNYISADEEADPVDIAEAEKYLNNYRGVTIDLYNHEEELVIEEDEVAKPTYHTDCNYYLYSGYYYFGERVTHKVWNHAMDLYRQGAIHGAVPYQCTFFAQMWFYDVYGFNSTGWGPSGNGGDMAYKVYAANTYYDDEGNFKHYFEISSEPKSMSILSVSGMSHPLGHVMCIDEYDPETNMITFSDGNVTNNSDIRIRVTMSYDEFRRQNPGYYVFATPTDELLQLIND